MFFHLYKYRIRVLLREKTVMFWSFLFPILLGTLFYFGFGSTMGLNDSYSAILVAVVQEGDTEQGSLMAEIMRTTEYSPGNPMFAVTDCSFDEASAMLAEKKVSGIVRIGSEVELVVGESGISQSILKQFTDTYQRTIALYNDIAHINPEALAEVANTMNEAAEYLTEVSLGGENYDSALQCFYALIAMACMYGSFIGLTNSDNIQANMSPLGARRIVASASYSKAITADMTAGLTINFAEIILVWLYLRFVLGIAIGTQPVLFLLVCFFGSMIGVAMGQFIGSITRGNMNLKVGISVGVSMISCFLSGLMIDSMKYVIEKNAPVLNRINPAALITDSFYCLTVYGDYKRFTANMVILAGMALLLTSAGIIAMRRAKYVSL